YQNRVSRYQDRVLHYPSRVSRYPALKSLFRMPTPRRYQPGPEFRGGSRSALQRINLRRMASESRAAWTGPSMVSTMTRLCAAFVAGRGSGFCSVITPRLYVSARGHLNDSPTSSRLASAASSFVATLGSQRANPTPV